MKRIEGIPNIPAWVLITALLLAVSPPVGAQQGQNQPIYDPLDPIARVLPPNVHILMDTSGSMSCQPDGANSGQCSNWDLLGWASDSKITAAKHALTELMALGSARVRWSLWIYPTISSNRTSYRSVQAMYNAPGKPTSALYSTSTPQYDTWVFSQNNCHTTGNRDRLLAPVYHVPGTTATFDPDPAQWFMSSVDPGYDNRPALRLWCDRAFDRTPPNAVPCGTTAWPFLTEFTAYGNTPIGYALQSVLMYVKGRNLAGGAQFANVYSITDDSLYSLTATLDSLDPYAACRENAVLLITDGLSNCGPGPVTSAATLFNLFHMKTFVIGFSLQSTSERAILDQIAVAGGTQHAYFIENQTELRSTVLRVLGRMGSEIGGDTPPALGFIPPAVPPTGGWRFAMPAGVLSQNVLYKASTAFTPLFRGHLRAFQALTANAADPAGRIDFLGDFSRTSPALLWDAAEVLENTLPADRNVVFADGSGEILPFDTAHRAEIRAVTGLAGLSDAQLDDFITFVREQGLGDFTHSAPVFVGPPDPDAYPDSDYKAWAVSLSGRCPMVLAGANDGMLHGFSALDGKEAWAFIPPAFLKGDADTQPKLYRELYGGGNPILQGQTDFSGPRTYNRRPHFYYVAATPTISTVRDGEGAWRTLCVFGLGAGGTEYYGLDLTDAIWPIGAGSGTFQPAFLWSFSGDPEKPLGETWSTPDIGRFGPVDAAYPYGQFLAAFGSGFDLEPPAEENRGKSVYLLDACSGKRVGRFDLDDPSVTVFGRVSTDLVSAVGNCIPSSVKLFDSPLDDDDLVEKIYFADYTGHLYRITVDGADPGQSKLEVLFRTLHGTPIYEAPEVMQVDVPRAGRLTLLAFAEYGSPVDPAASPVVNSALPGVFFFLVEERCGVGLSARDLSCSTGESCNFRLTGTDPETSRGFYLELLTPRGNGAACSSPGIFFEEHRRPPLLWMAGSIYRFPSGAQDTPNPCDPVNHSVTSGGSTALVLDLRTGTFFRDGKPMDFDAFGVSFGRSSRFLRGERGEGWVDTGTGEPDGFGCSVSDWTFTPFGNGNTSYPMNP